LLWCRYRAGRVTATIDLKHDRASRTAGIKIQCPMMALWGPKGKVAKWYEPLEIWRRYRAAEVIGGPVAPGHYLSEATPAEVLARFDRFFRSLLSGIPLHRIANRVHTTGVVATTERR
jgi:hypothetical protein